MIKSLVFRMLYWYLNKMDIHHQVTFMNYGYSESGKNIPLRPEDEQNRASLQLYHHLAEMTDLRHKDIVDVGSGRGGGLSYIAKTWESSSSTGIDMTQKSVDFSNNQHRHRNLKYVMGDAHNLPMTDNSCDVVFNVESSHRYHSMDLFLAEVNRILRPGGYFLFTDFRFDYEWPEVEDQIKNCGMEVIIEKDITHNVLESLKIDSDRRVTLVNEYAPRILRKALLNFSGAPGSPTFDNFVTRKYIYKTYKLQKTSKLQKTA